MAKQVSRVSNWNIGVNPVLYRDGKDKMGYHADDDQGETKILTVVVESPSSPRRVRIKVKGSHELEHGDEELELYLGAGDAYEMDGESW